MVGDPGEAPVEKAPAVLKEEGVTIVESHRTFQASTSRPHPLCPSLGDDPREWECRSETDGRSFSRYDQLLQDRHDPPSEYPDRLRRRRILYE